MSIIAIDKYLASDVQNSYFFFVGDREYQGAKEMLSELGFTLVRVSDYCGGDDKVPDIDGLLERLKTADVNKNENRLAIIGLGEYLALLGNTEAWGILSRLKDLSVGSAKVVLLLRGIAAQVKGLQADLRFDSRRFSMLDQAGCDLTLTVAGSAVGLPGLPGFKALLMALENGMSGNVVVNTSISLHNALFSVHRIADSYEGVKLTAGDFDLQRSCGGDTQWAELLTELMQNKGSLDAVFEKHGFGATLEADFYARAAGFEYRNWLYFIALKSRSDSLSNGYLRFVLGKTNRFEDFKANVLNAIIEIPHTDKRFGAFYDERKILVDKFPESDIAGFIVNNRKNPAESVHKLTDRTIREREEVVAWASQNGIIPRIADIYPALSSYAKRYVFNCGDLSNLLTEYFEAYKRQKVANKLEGDFIEKVENLAKSRDYNRLPTRNQMIEGMNRDDTYLYWLDALGVEYLAFILELGRTRGLSISINIARAELPTITAINRGFFDAWDAGRKERGGELDDTKHGDAGGYNFDNNVLPVHLAKELDIISRVIDKAATELALRHYRRFLIVSDHGASRLAVLRRKEEQYETDTKGEHSGRCCKLFEPYELPFAAQENGYLVLADYGRFKGSRAANVEVHGGASLEEVVIPIVELTLKDGNITVQTVEEFVTVDFRTGTEITLFSNFPLKNVSVLLNGKRYSASSLDNNHHKVVFPDTRRAGDYPADVYAGEDLIGKILIKARGKSGKINDAFDDLF